MCLRCIDLVSTNKENIQPIVKNTHETTRVKRAFVKGKWTNQALKETMEEVERGTSTMKKASRDWGIPLSSFTDHLNGRTRSERIRFGGVLIDEEDVAIVRVVLAMQGLGLFITLQQLKMKVVELTQIKPTPLCNGIFNARWWHWFKHHHLELNIKQVEGLEVCKAKGLTTNVYQKIYTNLQMLYTKHNFTHNTSRTLMKMKFKRGGKIELGC